MNTAAKITLLVATLFVVGFFIHLGIALYRTCCGIKATERSSPPPQTGSVLEIISGGSVGEKLPTKPDENPANKRFELGILMIWGCPFLDIREKLWMSWALLYYPYGVIAGKEGRQAMEEEREYVFKILEEVVELNSIGIEWIRAELKPENHKPFEEHICELTTLRGGLIEVEKQILGCSEEGEKMNLLQEIKIQYDQLIASQEEIIEEFESRRAKLLKLMEFSDEIRAYAKEDRAIVCAIFMFQRGWWSAEPEDQARCEKILTRFQKDGLLTLEDCQLVREELERCKDLTWAQFQEEDPERYRCCLEKLDSAWHQGPGFIAQRANKKGVKTPLID